MPKLSGWSEWLLRRHRIALAVAILAGVAAAIVGLSLATTQNSERVVYREAPPNCATSIALLGLEGQEVHCTEPPAPEGGAQAGVSLEPVMYGPFRLIPPRLRGAADL